MASRKWTEEQFVKAIASIPPVSPQQRAGQEVLDAYLAVRMTFLFETRQIRVNELLDVFRQQVLPRNVLCRQCTTHAKRRCLYGKQQGLACVAYWWLHGIASPERVAYLQTCPLDDGVLQTLSTVELLAIFWLRHFSFATMIDCSRLGFRERIWHIVHYSMLDEWREK